MNGFARSNVPPRPGPELEIIRVVTAGTFMFRVLSETLWGMWTHWETNHSTPCFLEKAKCYGCTKGLPRRWKGYVHVINALKPNSTGFLELTPFAGQQVLDQCPASVSMRGMRLQVTRTQGGAKGRLRITVLPDLAPGTDLPLEKTPEATLCRLWELTSLKHPNTHIDPI